MDVELISQLGFPIICCIVLAKFVMTIYKQSAEDGKEREQNYIRQLDRFSTALDEHNTTLLTINSCLEEVCRRLENLENKE